MNLREWSLFVIILIVVQACSGSGNLSSNSDSTREYSQQFGFMTKVVKGAIKGSGLKVRDVSQSQNPSQMTIRVIRSGYASSRDIPQESGQIFIVKKGESKTEVKIENPEYSYSVPQRQRQDYQKVLFPRIEKLIEINS